MRTTTGRGQDLWEAQPLRASITLEMRAGDHPALVPVQGENRVQVELAHAKAVVAALVDAAADWQPSWPQVGDTMLDGNGILIGAAMAAIIGASSTGQGSATPRRRSPVP